MGTDVAILVFSQAAALAISFALTPVQLNAMGAERYGVVALTAVLLSYLTFFDVGVGYALTHFVPYYLAASEEDQLRGMIFAALVVSSSLGAIGAVLVWSLAPWLSAEVLNVSPEVVASARFSVRLAALGLPLLLITSVFSGIGRGLGLFSASGYIRFFTFGCLNVSWALVAHSDRAVELVSITQLVIAGIGACAWAILVKRRFPGRLLKPTLHRKTYGKLLSYGVSASVSNFGHVLMFSVDKLILATILPVREIVYYTIPFALASQIPLLSVTVALVLFPRFSASAATEGAEGGSDVTTGLARASRGVLTLFNGLIVVTLVLAGPLILRVWLGSDFAENGHLVLSALAIGFGVQALGAVDQVYLQARGWVRTSAAIFLVSGSAGVLVLFVLASWFGVDGAAVATAAALAALGIAHMLAASRARNEPLLAGVRPVVPVWLTLAAIGAAVSVLARVAASMPARIVVPLITVVAIGGGPVLVKLALRTFRSVRAELLAAATGRAPNDAP
jgi:O-antigen/teichoic acid export membrane protein